MRRYKSNGGFSKDGIDGVSISHSSFVPSLRSKIIIYFSDTYEIKPSLRRADLSHGKFAIRPTIVRRTIVGQVLKSSMRARMARR